jgi:hypothetical protein
MVLKFVNEIKGSVAMSVTSGYTATLGNTTIVTCKLPQLNTTVKSSEEKQVKPQKLLG